MQNPNENVEKILEKIKTLDDKIWDAVAYISSDFCNQCTKMYDDIRKYKEEISDLKEELKKYETSN